MIAKRMEVDEPGVLATLNSVKLRGRVAAPPQVRVLASEIELVTVSVAVDRFESEDPRGRVRVDVIDCLVWSARLRRQMLGWRPGDVVEIDGALRRRFFRAGSGVTVARTEVEIARGRVLRRGARD